MARSKLALRCLLFEPTLALPREGARGELSPLKGPREAQGCCRPGPAIVRWGGGEGGEAGGLRPLL